MSKTIRHNSSKKWAATLTARRTVINAEKPTTTSMPEPPTSQKAAGAHRKPKTAAAKDNARARSKHDQILDMLRRKAGASLAELQGVSNWQPHSVRGFLSGTVKRRLGLKLDSSPSKDGERRYRITG